MEIHGLIIEMKLLERRLRHARHGKATSYHFNYFSLTHKGNFSIVLPILHQGIVEKEQIHSSASRGLRTTEMSFSITWV